MTYSTCTIHVKENEEMIWHILDEYPSMQLVPPGLPGLDFSDDECASVHHFDPSNVEADTTGFFMKSLRLHE